MLNYKDYSFNKKGNVISYGHSVKIFEKVVENDKTLFVGKIHDTIEYNITFLVNIIFMLTEANGLYHITYII